jgi:drug/metabolite transporter (DMT)-like permease
MRYLYAILAFTAWGVNSIVLRFLEERGVTGPIPGFCGTVIAAALLLTAVGKDGRSAMAKLYLRFPWRMAVQAIAFSFTSLTYQLAIQKTSMANAALTHSLQPIFTCLIFAPLLYKKRPSRMEMLAITLGIAGMYALLANKLAWNGHMEGIGYGVLSAVCYSCSLLNVASFPKDIDRKVLVAAILTTSVPVLLPFSLYAGFPAMDLPIVGLLVLFGTLGYAAANVFYITAVRMLSVGHLATLSYLEPVVAIVAAALWLNEPVTANALIGGALILASSGIIAYDGITSPRPRS